jgi:hypothetical protein
MDKNPNITGSHDKYLTNETAKEFLTHSTILRYEQSEKISKKLKKDNNIKHLMLSFHNNDKQIFDNVKDKIIKDLFQELGIDPETHLANIFIHNDKSHPHFHVLFSKVGEGYSIFNDQEIGKRMGTFAKKMNKKYRLHHPPKNESKISLGSKLLHNPTVKGDLLKLIDFATKEAQGIQDFQDILRKHGVKTKLNKDSELIYMLPVAKIPTPEEVNDLIELARRNTKTKEQFKSYLHKKGIFVKYQADGKESISVKKVIAWKEDSLPKACGLRQVYRNIKTRNHDPQYLEVRKILSEGIESCETLGQIKALLPGSELKFDQRGSKLYNVTLEYEDMVIRLHEVFTKDISMDLSQQINDPWQIPIIFVPRYHNKDAEEWEWLQKKKPKKRPKIQFKI